MFKKFFIFITCMLIAIPAFATDVVVQSREKYSTKYPKRTVSMKVINEVQLENGIRFEQDSIIRGRILEVKAPKRGKIDAYFIFAPTSYSIPSKGITKSLRRSDLEAKLTSYKPFNTKDAAVKTSVSAGGLVVPGFSQAFWFSKGAAKPIKGKTRMSSGMYSMYKNSPFVYIEEGNELIVKKGTYLKLDFYYTNVPKWKIWKKV